MIPLDESLADVNRICFDTMSIIYFVEAHPRYVPLVRSIFRRINAEQLTGIASTVTLLEVLVRPLRLGNAMLAENYRRFLSASGNFELRPVTESIAETAADLRAMEPANGGRDCRGHRDPIGLPGACHQRRTFAASQ